MSLSPGTRLGHYDVTALLGEGAWDRSGRPKGRPKRNLDSVGVRGVG